MANTKGRTVFFSVAVKYLCILLGSVLTAAGLEIFLKAHNLIAGGVIGAAVALSYLMEIPLSTVVVLLNFPFLIFGFRHQGKSVLLPTLVAMISLIYWTNIFNPGLMEYQDILRSTILGGTLLGLGSGLILQYGGYVDGIEYQRAYFNLKLSGNANRIFIIVNFLILFGAGMVFDWEKALFSMGAYFIVFKVNDYTLEFFGKTKKVIVISEKADEVKEQVLHRLGKSTRLKEEGADASLLDFDVSNYELAYLKSVVHDIDKDAQVYFDERVLQQEKEAEK